MSLGLVQILVIALVAILLFGRGRVSALMEDLARGIKSFKKGMSEDDAEQVYAQKSCMPPESDPDRVIEGRSADKDTSKV